MIPISELQRIAQARLEDAKTLLAADRHDGATYLCGYAVELALKFRICQILNWPEFPSTTGEFRPYRSFQTHELDVLLRLSGQEARIKRDHFAEWNTVAVWKPEVRYSVVGTVAKSDAELMIVAAEGLLKVL
jgi:HEPN domain-containing protein